MAADKQWLGVVWYAAAVVAIVSVVGWAMSLGFTGPGDGGAIRLSGAVVVVVQLSGFAAIKLLGGRRLLVGWGIMAALRLLTMVIYAVLVAKVLPVPLVSAVLSMATFFFLSTLIEPLLLRL